MVELGHFSLLLAFFLSGYAILTDILGACKDRLVLQKSGRNATIASFVCLTVAVFALWVLLIKGDFSVTYVADHTAKALPFLYKVSALWAGAAGSLLFWLWLQVGLVVLVFSRTDPENRTFSADARAAANLVSVFFLLVLILDKNPFALSLTTPDDGAGLNPLLQHPAMAIHPPTLFIGYAAFAVPFAWAIASLRLTKSDQAPPLFKQARNWVLWAWLFLTIGIVLGAWWAYEELGWGGYWAWDPVENSSLMPWLIATALLHCSRTYGPRTPIAKWFKLLSMLTFSLCIFGTFLTRYGLVSSVHAFPDPGLGILFIVLLIHIWVIAGIILLKKYITNRKTTAPKPPQTQDHQTFTQWLSVFVSRGANFIIVNNYLLILLTLVILIGTIFPFLSGLFSDNKTSLKPEYFTKITAPGGLTFLLLLSICPHLFRNAMSKHWRTIIAAVVAVFAAAAWLLTGKIAPACLVISGFAAFSLMADFAIRLIKSKAKPNLRWYGARIVHVGVVLAFIGIAGSGGYDTEDLVALRPGQKHTVAGFDLVYRKLSADHGPNFTAIIADIDVYKSVDPNDPNAFATGEPNEPNASLITTLKPAKAVYAASGKSTSEVDVRRTLAYDLYVAVTNIDAQSQLINLRVLVKPLINWIWIGAVISVIGTMLVLISFYTKKKTILQPEQDKDIK